MAERVRLFVGVRLPGSLGKSVAAYTSRVEKSLPGAYRWVAPESLHLTFRFLGDVPSEDVPRLCQVLGSVAAKAGRLVSSGAVCLPSDRQPRVWAVAFEDPDGSASSLKEGVDAACAGRGRDEGRSFLPHMTVGRLRPGSALRSDVVRRARSDVPVPELSFPVRSFELIRSVLGPQGSHYETVAAFPIGIGGHAP